MKQFIGGSNWLLRLKSNTQVCGYCKSPPELCYDVVCLVGKLMTLHYLETSFAHVGD